MSTPRPGELRITIPLEGALMGEHGALDEPRRIPLDGRDALVVLDASEVERFRVYNGQTLRHRLELFDCLPDDWDSYAYWEEVQEDRGSTKNREVTEKAIARIGFVLACQALACRKPFTVFDVLVDRFNGIHWERETHLRTSATWSGRGGMGHFPVERLDIWAKLVRNFAGSDKRILLAMNFYRQSVDDSRKSDYDRAFVLCAIALEVLLSDARSEIAHKASQRGSLLTSINPAHRIAIYRDLKRMYDSRSKLIHRGENVSREQCTLLQQFLMSAIPRMAATGLSIEELHRDLDQHALGAPLSTSAAVVHSSGWWSYCDFPSLLAKA